jgi:hypothetical protein
MMDEWVRLTVHPFRGLLPLLRVDFSLVDESLDFSVHDVAVLAPENLRVHWQGIAAEFFAARDGPLGGDTAVFDSLALSRWKGSML